jgi:DNA or RNA helicases of superfamily II
MISLRPYQAECIASIPDNGSYLIQMATGLGKTVTFANVPRQGKMLILSHREELVKQPLKYFECETGIEMASQSSNGEPVISASVQSLIRRLDRFQPNEFDIIITDEAHHAAANSYKKIYQHFRPRLHLGFTATPNRSDQARLNDVFQDIIFKRDLRWGIENNYLSDIVCKRIHIGFDLRNVRTQGGDFAPGELEKAMDGTADAIAEAYRDHAVGATLIFAVSVHQAEEIAKKIPGAVSVTADTKGRSDIIAAFSRREIPCLVNCMVFTEGTDIPLVETVIIARPTQSDSLYAQMVGRGLRLHPNKECLNLIDCVGVTGKASLCTAPSLLGIDLNAVPKSKLPELEGFLLDMPVLAAQAADTPESWIRNVEIINLWAKQKKYQTHDVNWFRMPDGSMVCSLKNAKLRIGPEDELGMAEVSGKRIDVQMALDQAYRWLRENRGDEAYLWDLGSVKRWGALPATDKQLAVIKRRVKFPTDGMTKGQASMVLNRLMGGRRDRSSTPEIDFSMGIGDPVKISGPKTFVPYSEWRQARQDRSGQSESSRGQEGSSGHVPAGFTSWVS